MLSTGHENINDRRTAGTERANPLLEGSIWKGLVLFFFPLLLGTFFQTLYNTVDAVVVGRFIGKEGLSAVGGASSVIINLLVGFFVGVSSGATVVIAQRYGAGQKSEVEKAVHTAAALSVAGGAVMTVICMFGAPLLLGLLNTPADTFSDSQLYIRIYALGMIPNMIYNMGSGILRAGGDSKRPTYFLIAGCLANIVLDLLFVAVFSWGVAGAAIATIMSQTLSAILTVVSLTRTEEVYRLDLRRVRFERVYLRSIIAIGLPAGFNSSLYSISNLVIQAAVNGFGTDAVAAWAAWGRIDALYWMVVTSFSTAITTFVSQNYGAGKGGRVRGCVRQSSFILVAISIAFSILFRLMRIPLLRLFISDPGVIEDGRVLADGITPWYVLYMPIQILSAVLIGLGDALAPTIMTVTGVCVVRIIWCAVMVPRFHHLQMVTMNYPVSWVITSIAFIIYYRKTIGKFVARIEGNDASRSG